MTPHTLEQIARETAQQIAHLYLAKNGCPFPDMSNEEFVAFSVLDYSPLILTALQTATKQPEGADWAEAAAKEITGFISPQWDPFYISAKQKKIETDAAIIRKHAPLVANREDYEAIGQRHTADRISYIWTRTPDEIPEGTVIYIKKTAAMRPAQPERGQGEGK